MSKTQSTTTHGKTIATNMILQVCYKYDVTRNNLTKLQICYQAIGTKPFGNLFIVNERTNTM
jgi:hypothetical protein